MLESTKKYLDALLQDNYLQFLQWPAYVQKKYEGIPGSNPGNPLNGLVFELINSEFKEEHVNKLAVLSRLLDDNSSSLPGAIQLSCTTISEAFLEGMIIKAENLSQYYITSKEMTSVELDTFMNENFLRQEADAHHSSIDAQSILYSEKVKAVSKEVVTGVYQQILPIIEMRKEALSYFDVFQSMEKSSELASDTNKHTRLTLITGLKKYLDELTDWNSEAKVEIGNYVKQIQATKPALYEARYLSVFIKKLNPEPNGPQVVNESMLGQISRIAGNIASLFYSPTPQNEAGVTVNNNTNNVK